MQYQQQQAMQQYYHQQAMQQQYQQRFFQQVEQRREPEPEPVQVIQKPKQAAPVPKSDPLLDLVNNNKDCYQVRTSNAIPTYVNSHLTVLQSQP
jgi:hypothetical protein